MLARKPGKALTFAQLRALATAAGFPDPRLAAAVAMAESGGKAWIIVPEPKGGPSFGLWQIHLSDHPQFRGVDLLDPATNARAALEISRNGADWSPWSTYKNGLHKPYLQT